MPQSIHHHFRLHGTCKSNKYALCSTIPVIRRWLFLNSSKISLWRKRAPENLKANRWHSLFRRDCCRFVVNHVALGKHFEEITLKNLPSIYIQEFAIGVPVADDVWEKWIRIDFSKLVKYQNFFPVGGCANLILFPSWLEENCKNMYIKFLYRKLNYFVFAVSVY